MTADQELKKINDALIANPKLRACFLEMIDTAADETGELNNGDDAEDAVIGVIEKTGRELLQGWLEKKAEQAEIEAEADPTIRPHEKKRLSGIRLLETSS